MKAIVVDKDYGSVSAEELERVRTVYAAAGIEMDLLDYQVVAAQQKEPTEDEIIAGCKGAEIILATGKEQYEIFTLKELLPLGFGPNNLK